MNEDQIEYYSDESAEGRKWLLAALLLGGATLIVAGVLLWNSVPTHRVDRMLSRAQQKVSEIEEVLESLT